MKYVLELSGRFLIKRHLYLLYSAILYYYPIYILIPFCSFYAPETEMFDRIPCIAYLHKLSTYSIVFMCDIRFHTSLSLLEHYLSDMKFAHALCIPYYVSCFSLRNDFINHL